MRYELNFHKISFRLPTPCSLRCTLFWVVEQSILIAVYRRFAIAYQSHLQGSNGPRPLKKGPIGFSETSVSHHQNTLPNDHERAKTQTYTCYSTHFRLQGFQIHYNSVHMHTE